MSNSSSGGFGIGSLIFLVFMYNVIFDDDDDKNEVDIIEQDTIVQTTPAPELTIKDSLNKIKNESVVLLKSLKNDAISIKDSVKQEFNKKGLPITSEEVVEPKVELEVVNSDSKEPDQLNEKSNKSDDTMTQL